MQTSQTKDTLANNKGDRSEFNAWLGYFWSHGEKPPDRTCFENTTKDGTELSRQGTTLPPEPPDIITAAQEYLASRIELSIT